MASIEFIAKRIEGAEKNIAKLEAKLSRIRKVEAQNWEDPNPYYYSEHDLKYCLKDLDEARKALVKYQDQLKAETEKSMSRNVPAIVEFLNGWKSRVLDWYINSENGLIDFYNEKDRVHELYQKCRGSYYYNERTPEYQEYNAAETSFRRKRIGYFEKQEIVDRWGKKRMQEVKIREGEYEWIREYTGEATFQEAHAKLLKDLDQEWNRKYDFIIERTNAIVGVITDASHLRIGEKGDLNGYIIGTKGTAKVQTIGAGGYAVQCFHFRTLINPMN